MRPLAVIFALAALVFICLGRGAQPLQAQGLYQQYGHRDVDKGPRALGLVQITPTGKARIVPIVIMLDGKFYDAGSFKATPVPMALDFGIVYEGFHTGVSQGIFTITQPGQLNHEWIAEGKWLPAGAKAPETSKKYEPPVIEEDSRDDRPVLHRRRGSSDDKDDDKPAATPPATTSSPGSQPSSQPTSTPSAPTLKRPEEKGDSKDAAKDTSKDTPKPAATETARRDSADEPMSDPNRPRLRRGKPDPSEHHEPFVNFDDPTEFAKATKEAAATAPSVQTVTAISDAAGPDPRPYTYDLKPAEEAIYRNKMFELAAQQLKGKAQQTSSQGSSGASAKGKTSAGKAPARPPKPQFDDVSLRIFDLSNSNEPILVLSAKTHPLPTAAIAKLPEPQEITLIARTDLEGELQKLYFAQTDSKHLDMRPRMELIDAVDADGDGRGELLFRKTSGAGSAYAIYRVTADGLWPLFEGTP
jgi:hypothetical protein